MPGGKSETASGDEFVAREELPNPDWNRHWEHIYVDEESKRKLVNFGLLEEEFSRRNLDRMSLSHHGAVLLSGPPGTGKTTLAKGAANQLAKALDTPVVFKQMKVQSLFSSGFGDTPELVEAAFLEVIEPAKSDAGVFQVLLLDEVESIFSNRSVLTGDNDPYDAVRAVNEALRLLDEIAELPGIYIIATSNQPRGIDRAFYDRTDEQIYVGNPAATHRASIFDEVFGEFNGAFGTSLPTERSGMTELLDVSDGFSGRRIRKTILSALSQDANTIRNPGQLTYDQVLAEFRAKKELLESDTSANYIKLGVREEGRPAADDAEENPGDETEATAADADPPPAAGSESDGHAEPTPAEGAVDSPADRDTEPGDRRGRRPDADDGVDPEPSADPETGPAGSRQSLEPRTVVLDRTQPAPATALRNDVVEMFGETLELADRNPETMSAVLTSDEMEEIWYKLCMMRTLERVVLTVSDTEVPIEVSYDQGASNRLRGPSPDVFAGPSEADTVNVTFLVSPSAADTFSSIDVQADGFEIDVKATETE